MSQQTTHMVKSTRVYIYRRMTSHSYSGEKLINTPLKLYTLVCNRLGAVLTMTSYVQKDCVEEERKKKEKQS